MSDNAASEANTETAPEAQAAPQKETFLPDDVYELQKEVLKLRREAAKYRSDEDPEHKALRNEVAKYQRQAESVDRVKAKLIREHEEKLLERESAFDELQGQLSERGLELMKLKAVISEGIPVEDVLDVADLIQGSDEASVSESVKRVKSLLDKAPVKERPVDPSQGSGNVLPLNGDPLLETVKRMVGA